MTEINELIKLIKKVTKGEEWTNFDGQKDSLFVYEYDRLTEETCDIIAECKTVEVAKFIADMPEQFRQFITTIESQKEEIEKLMEEKLEWATTADHGWHVAGEETIKFESLKAITELAVKELKVQFEAAKVWGMDGSTKSIQTTLNEIAKIQIEQT